MSMWPRLIRGGLATPPPVVVVAGIKPLWLVYIGRESKPVHGSRERMGEDRLEPEWAD